MIRQTTIVNYEDVKKTHLFIDVRSPGEYAYDTIPGAINIPLFNDEERALVGTAYVQESKVSAKRLGAKIAAPKLPAMLDQLIALKEQHDNLVCFCERGGYRSTFFTAIFNAIDIFLLQLNGGYKEYRRLVRDQLPICNDLVTYIVLHGVTGCGKTDILHALRELHYDILDLEGAANHRGSLLGGIGLGECTSQKKFESNIYHQLDMRNSNTVFIEAESKRIGKNIIPEYIFHKMKAGLHVKITADISVRLQVLKKDYTAKENWQAEALQAMPYMEKYMNKAQADILRDWVSQGDFDSAAVDFMENYYDPMYLHTDKKMDYNYQFTFENKGSATEAAKEMVAKLGQETELLK